MTEDNKKKVTENLIPTFNEAGDISLKLRKQGLKKEIKKDNTPVTNGDIEVNNLITEKIKKIISKTVEGTQLQAAVLLTEVVSRQGLN